MALFGKADQNLPCLTKFIQVDVPVSDTDLLTSELRQFWHDQAVALSASSARSFADVSTGYVQNLLADLAALHRLAVPLMEALADGGSVPAGILKEIQERLDGYTRRRIILYFAPEGNEGMPEKTRRIGKAKVSDYADNCEIPVSNLLAYPTGEMTDIFIVQVLDELLDLLTKAPWTWNRLGQPVIRCAECNSPFVVQRGGQKYCSHRCGARVHIRKRRKQEKNQAMNLVELA